MIKSKSKLYHSPTKSIVYYTVMLNNSGEINLGQPSLRPNSKKVEYFFVRIQLQLKV